MLFLLSVRLRKEYSVGEGWAKRTYALFLSISKFPLIFYLLLFSYFNESYEIKIESFVIVPDVFAVENVFGRDLL